MKTFRVALMGMPPRLRDILTDAVAREPDMDLIDYQEAELAAARPDVVVCLSQNPFDVGPATRLLREVPGARVLLVADSGNDAALYEFRPTRTVIRAVGIEQVIQAIRYGPEGSPGVVADSTASS